MQCPDGHHMIPFRQYCLIESGHLNSLLHWRNPYILRVDKWIASYWSEMNGSRWGRHPRRYSIECLNDRICKISYLVATGRIHTKPWAIGCLDSCKSGKLSAICWQYDSHHRWSRIQCPDNNLYHCDDRYDTCHPHSYKLCDVCESHCHKCGDNCQDSSCVVLGNCQDWSSPKKLRPSTCLQFSSKWLISMIVFTADIANQVLTMIASSRGKIVFRGTTTQDPMARFQTQTLPEIQRPVANIMAKVRSTCRTNVRELSL